jgi:hypothetical protein
VEWFRQNAFIAAWLSPLVALIGIIIRGTGKSGETDWSRAMLYIAFLTSLAAAFTPALGSTERGFATTVVTILLVWFFFDTVPRGGNPPTRKEEPPKPT